ncbi:uncharacterized protein DUF262/uncharacterized protein DUF1524 [Micrococcus sp. 140720015-1]
MRGQVSGILSVYGNVDRELIIPVYQRNYDWREKHCAQLLEDLSALIREDRGAHFFGSVVGDPESFRWVVIDGQQRLTTVSLLLLALVRLLEDGTLETSEDGLAERIRRNYLVRDGETASPRFRLKPVKHDAEAYRCLFRADSASLETSTITKNYRYFLEQLPGLGLSGDQIWKAVQGLEVMILDLEKQDDAQRIFESLNSTGLALSEADKVRNLVLMGLPSKVQEQVYTDHWNRIEENVAYDTSVFLRWFLVTKTGKTPKISDVYEAFKAYARSVGTTGAELLAPVRAYSDYYRQLRDSATGHSAVDRRLHRLNLMNREVLLPLLMPMVEELHRGTITPDDFADAVRVLESYLFRRLAVGRASNALNSIFATLHREVSRIRPDDARFTDALVYSLRRRSGSGEFPLDEDFVEGFRAANMYRLPASDRRYLFESLENGESQDTRDIAGGLIAGDLTVEHVMPQTLTPEWRQELGEEADRVHAQWLHRIGNLTVTGYNSTYSNASFTEKKTLTEGFNFSPFRLNAEMKERVRWDEHAIEARTERLIEQALTIWPLPSTDFKPPRPQLPVEPMGTEGNFKGRYIVAYEFQGRRHVVNTWRDFAVLVLRDLLEIDRARVLAMAKQSDAYRVEGQEVPPGREKNFVEIEPGLLWNLWSDTMTKVNALRRMCEAAGVDPDDIMITLRPSEEDAAPDESVEDSLGGQYDDVVKFLPLLERAAGSSSTDPEVVQLADEIENAFEGRLVEAPAKVLGLAPAKFAADTKRMTEATPDQAAAVISGVIVTKRQLDPDAVRDAVANGSMAAFVRRLA